MNDNTAALAHIPMCAEEKREIFYFCGIHLEPTLMLNHSHKNIFFLKIQNYVSKLILNHRSKPKEVSQ